MSSHETARLLQRLKYLIKHIWLTGNLVTQCLRETYSLNTCSGRDPWSHCHPKQYFDVFCHPTHSPLKRSNVTYTKFIRNTKACVIRDKLKTFYFLDLKDIKLISHHWCKKNITCFLLSARDTHYHCVKSFQMKGFCLVWIRKNTDQKTLHIWTLFTQCMIQSQ